MLMVASGTSAQSYYAIQINKEKGLPANEVYDILQDTKGFIWIACDEGLVRYDGSNFKTFRNKDQHYLAGSSIREDKLGRIWYENFDGHLYYTSGDSLKAFSEKHTYVYYPFALINQYLFRAENRAIQIYDVANFKLQKSFPVTDSMLLYTATDADNFYALTNKHLIKINARLEEQSLLLESLKSSDFNWVFADGGRVFLGSMWNNVQHIYVLDSNLNFVHSLIIPEQHVALQCAFIDDNYWVQTPQGVYKFDQNGHFKEKLFSEISISKVLKDRQSNYWFASNKSGIQIVPNFSDRFFSVPNFLPKSLFLFQNDFFFIDEKGRFWSSDTNFKSFRFTFQDALKTPIRAAFLDRENNILAYVSKGASFSQLPSYHHTLHTAVALKSMAVVDEKYWAIATNAEYALMRIPFKNGASLSSEWDSLFHHNSKVSTVDAAKLSKDIVRGRCIVFDKNEQTIYASGNSGLYSFQKNKTTELLDKGKPFYAKELFVFDGALYAINTRGVFYKIHKDKDFELLSDSFNIDVPIRMAKQFDQDLLLVTDAYVYHYSFVKNSIEVINISINTREINDLFWNDTTLVIATDNGIIRKEYFKQNNVDFVPELVLDKALVDDIAFDYTEKIIIPGKESKMQIFYAVPEFGNVQKQQLYYRIDEGEWRAAPENANTLELLSLPDGKHKLSFKLNEVLQDVFIDFEVLIPIWKRWWFILSVLGITIAVSGFVYRKRINNLRKRIGLLEEKVILEQELGKSIVKSVKAQMNPHFFYNALNTIQAYIYLNDKLNAGKYLSKFSALTRKILEMSEQESITLSEEISTLELYLELEKMRFEDELDIQINVAASIDTDFVKIPSMLIQPFVENAIKHGLLHKRNGTKMIEIDFSYKNEMLQVRIADNGVGRVKAEEINRVKNKHHNSFSTEANNKRIEVLNKHTKRKIELEIIDEYDANGEAKGTTVLVLIPHQG